jgi:hypothetical protein
MKKINEYLGNFLLVIGGGVVITLWIIGFYHGSKRHEAKPFDDALGFFQCFYFGAERFWHGVDPEELNETVKMGVYIVMDEDMKKTTSDRIGHYKVKKEFVKIIDSYTSEEFDYVNNGVEDFIEFLNLSFKETRLALSRGERKLIFSSKHIRLKKNCRDHGLKEEVQSAELFLKDYVRYYDQMKVLQKDSRGKLPSMKKFESRFNQTILKARKTSLSLFKNS